MSQKMTFTGLVIDGGLSTFTKAAIASTLKRMDDNTRITIEIYETKDNRSIQQNRRQWAIYTEVAAQTGYTKEEIHQYYRRQFLSCEKVDKVTGELYPYVQSTTELTIEEHCEYTERIEAHAATEFGVVLQLEPAA